MKLQRKEPISFFVLLVLAFWTAMVFSIADFLPFALSDTLKIAISFALSAANLFLIHRYVIQKPPKKTAQLEKKIEEIGEKEEH